MSQNYVLAITIQYWWGPLGTILGPFGPIWAHLEVPELDIEAIWMEIVLTAQNDLNAPKYCTVLPTKTIQYWWGPLGAFRGHLEQFWAHLEAPEQDIEAILGMISPLSSAQNDLSAPKLFTVAQVRNTQNLGGPRAFIGHFGALKQDFGQYWDNFLHFFSQNGPDLHLWPLNGPHC